MAVVSRLAAWRPALTALVPWMALLCFLGWATLYVSPDSNIDDADPEVLNLAWRVAQGKTLYSDFVNPPYFQCSYTPLYPWSVAALLRRTGLSFLPSAFVSFLSSLLAFSCFMWLGRQWQGRWRDGAWTGALYFLVPAVLDNSVRTHPQMMGTALSILALALFARQRFLETAVLSPLVSVLAIYAKQSLVAFPVAMGLWLLLRKRRWLVPYAAVLLVCGLPPAWWLEKATGGLFWLNIVTMNKLGYHPLQIVPVMIHHAGPLFLLLGLAAAMMWRRFRTGKTDFMDYYLAVAGGWTIISCGRDGAHVQYVIELCAVALLFLLRVTGLPALPGRDRLVAAQLLLLLVYAPLHVALEHGPFALQTRRASKKVLPLIREHPGPMISQAGGLALFGSGEIYIQLGHFMNLARTGLWDQRRILADVTARKLEWAITFFDIDSESLSADDRERFTPELLAALRQNYRMVMREGPYYLYRPLPVR